MIKTFRRQVWKWLYFFSVYAFFLPFVSVKGCHSDKITHYIGLELINVGEGKFYYIPIGIGILFLVFSFLKFTPGTILQAFLKGGKAIGCLISGAVAIFYPFIQFLFDTVYIKIGQVLCAGCWIILYLYNYAVLLKSYLSYDQMQKIMDDKETVFLQILVWLFGVVLGISVPVYHLIDVMGVKRTGVYLAKNLALSLLLIVLITVPVYLTTYFLIEAIKRKEKWAIRFSRLLLLFSLLGALIWKLILLRR
jgi:hypothetical protein